MTKLLAFHNDPKIKAKYLKRVLAHQKADEIIQGIYWKNGKGCAVGCTVERNSDAHKAMEKELGIPEVIGRLEDGIFEGLSNGEAKEFPYKFLKAIPVGADLSKVEYEFKLWLLIDKHNGVRQYANEETKKIIDQIAQLQKEAIEGNIPSEDRWYAARSAARSAAESAAGSARSAAWSAAESARSARSARSATWSARSVAESAAWSAAESAARSVAWSARSVAWAAAWSAAYKSYAKKLLQLLKEAK